MKQLLLALTKNRAGNVGGGPPKQLLEMLHRTSAGVTSNCAWRTKPADGPCLCSAAASGRINREETK